MFLIPHGSYTIILNACLLRGEICNNCKESHGLIATKYANVKHAFWIPLFFTTYTELECKYCQENFDLRGLNREKRDYYKSLIPFKFLPIWLFPIPLICLIIAIVYLFNQNSDKQEMSRRLEETPMNRILEYDIGDNSYSALKIVGVTADGYLYLNNKLSIADDKAVSRILDEKYFMKDTLISPKNEFQQWIREGKVISVHY